LYRCGYALDELKRYEEALQNYDRAIDGNPNASHFWHNKGITLANSKRYEQAIVAYDKAIQINRYYAENFELTTSDSWYARGVALYAMKRYQESVNSFDLDRAIKARSVAQKQLR
jgi:tetratricopeptide (TPR) repeat protein